MSAPRLLFFNALLLLLLNVDADRREKTHYHRYMLSDYKPQHNPNTQMDYRRHGPPRYPKERANRPDPNAELMIEMSGTGGVETPLSELLVRIYDDDIYLCMGTLITELLIMTAATCFANVEHGNLTVKTSSNDLLQAYPKGSSDSFVVANDTLLTVLALYEPVQTNATAGSNTAQLCQKKLKARDEVELPTYIRSKRMVHNQLTRVLPLEECRQKFRDTEGKLITDAMICVRNNKFTANCSNSFGNPLVHEGSICGVNIMGHNCPKRYGVDLYASVLSASDFVRDKFDAIRESKLEDEIF